MLELSPLTIIVTIFHASTTGILIYLLITRRVNRKNLRKIDRKKTKRRLTYLTDTLPLDEDASLFEIEERQHKEKKRLHAIRHLTLVANVSSQAPPEGDSKKVQVKFAKPGLQLESMQSDSGSLSVLTIMSNE